MICFSSNSLTPIWVLCSCSYDEIINKIAAYVGFMLSAVVFILNIADMKISNFIYMDSHICGDCRFLFYIFQTKTFVPCEIMINGRRGLKIIKKYSCFHLNVLFKPVYVIKHT